MALYDDNKWSSYTLFAYRLAGEKGWTFALEVMNLNQFAEAMCTRGFELA